VLQEGPGAHDLVVVGTTKAHSGNEPDIVMESISLIDPADFMSMNAMGDVTRTKTKPVRFPR